MNKQKMTIIIICTVLAMALVAVGLVMWLVPRGNHEVADPSQSSEQTPQAAETEETETIAETEALVTDPTETTAGKEEGNTQSKPDNSAKPTTPTTPTQPQPTITVEIEEETEPVNNDKNEDSGDNFEIDFDDLLG